MPPGGFVPVVVKAVWDGEREGGNWAGGRSKEAGPVPTAVVARKSVEM